MTEHSSPDSWRQVADAAVVPHGGVTDQSFWHDRLRNRYALEVQPLHEAVWRKALGLLATYGSELCWVNGPFENHPNGAALTTGALLLGEPTQYGDTTVMNAMRLSVANGKLTAKGLSPKECKAAATGNAGAYDIAVDALNDNHELTSIHCAAFVLATAKDALTNTDALRDTLREATPPLRFRGRMTLNTSRPHSDDIDLMNVLQKRPQVALWSRLLGVFGSHSNYTYIHRPEAPELDVPYNASMEEYHGAVDTALARVMDSQPYASMLLDMMASVTQPVRGLGALAITDTSTNQ
jgi:hypothetical protein